MQRRALAVVNPQSAGGRTAKRWPALEARLRERLGPLDVEHTRGPRDAERIAREAARAGTERIIVAGGDGTLSEVATGLLGNGLGEYAELGILPLGTGGDFARGLGIPADFDQAIDCIAGGVTRKVDAGRVDYRGADGPRTAYFVNVASFGISGLVNERVSGSSRALGGTLAFALGALRAIFEYESQHVVIRVDGEVVHDAPLILAAGANAPFFGGGMHVAPGAEVDDGYLDLVVVGALSKLRLVALLARGYRGEHVHHPVVTQHRGRVIEADALEGRVPIELDGDPLGSLPARYEVLPGALRVLAPAMSAA
jgi:YegS/Rv2252/BmrU family lipid kinase